jgi:hypothetical protein
MTQTPHFHSWSETRIKEAVLPHLERLGSLEHEVGGTCYTPCFSDGQTDPAQWTTTRVRIDSIITFHSSLDLPPMGIEFKKFPLSNADRGKFLRQCIDYRMTLWDNKTGHLPILMCPGFNTVSRVYSPHAIGYGTHEADRRWIAAFGIGEIELRLRPTPSISILFASSPFIHNGRRTSHKRYKFAECRGAA